MGITKHHWTIISMVMISFFFLFLDGYYLQVEQTQNSKQNDDFTQGFTQISRECLESIQTTEASVYEDIPKWLPGCEKIFLDLGANIGITVKKLFEPENYPKKPYTSFL